MSGKDRCDRCNAPGYPLYQVPGGSYVCAHCVTPSESAGYPGFRKRLDTLIRKQDQARKNFAGGKK